MRLLLRRSSNRSRRRGTTLVLTAILLPVLFGMVGLVIDGGLLLAAHRHAQAAADAAALAGAVDLVKGLSSTTAKATALSYVTTHQAQKAEYDNLANAKVTANSPPSNGPYAGNNNYVEVIVTNPVKTYFIQILNLVPGVSVSAAPSVQVRAVAGYEKQPAQDAITTLAPNAVPGLSFHATSSTVQGTVAVNSLGSGYDQNGNFINLGKGNYGVVSGSGTLRSNGVKVVGGVDTPGNIQNLSGGIGNPPVLRAGLLPQPDPLDFLPAPNASNVSNLTGRGNVNVNSGSVTLSPGVYDYISIGGTASVTFSPGIYVIAATRSNALVINTKGTVTGNGIMFYNTGSDFKTGGAGSHDAQDGIANPTSTGAMPTASDSTTFGNTLIVTNNKVSLSGLNDASSPFNGMLFYQRRLNPQLIMFLGTDGQPTITAGTVYAKWAPIQIYGQTKYNAQFISASMQISRSDQGSSTAIGASPRTAVAGNVYLVE